MSVTIPFKEEIIPLIDELDPQAARIGAVNTVVNRDGRLVGYNTDWLGAMAALKAKTGLKGEHVLLLGAGGASRAIAFGILEEGGRVTLTDVDAGPGRGPGPGPGGGGHPPGRPGGLPRHHPGERHPGGYGTRMWMVSPSTRTCWAATRLVMDIVYQPLETRLLREAKAAAPPPSTACRCSSTRPRRSLSCGPARGAPWKPCPGRLIKLYRFKQFS